MQGGRGAAPNASIGDMIPVNTLFKPRARGWCLCLVMGASLLGACSSYNSATGRIARWVTPYRVTIVQGNFVSREAAARLQPGMSREQVRTTIGTPLLTDMFHADRWDYVFYFKRGSNSVVEKRDLVLNFNGDSLLGWSGADDLPSEQDLIAMIDGEKREDTRGRQITSASKDAAQARQFDTAASAPAAAAPAASGTQAPNERAAAQVNQRLAAPEAASAPGGNAPQPVVRGGPPSATPELKQPSQIHLTPTRRPIRSDSSRSDDLARPPATTPSNGTE